MNPIKRIIAMNSLKRKTKFKVKIFAEGPIPHFHLITKDDEYCINLVKPSYFLHGKYRSRIMDKQIKHDFCKFMEEKVRISGDKEITNWEYLVLRWNELNEVFKIPLDTCQPNYRDALTLI